MGEYSNYNIFSFKSVSCEYEDGIVSLSNVDLIFLINEKEEKANNKKMMYIIIGVVGIGLIMIATNITICMIRKKPESLVDNGKNMIINQKEAGINLPNIKNNNKIIKKKKRKINNKIVKKKIFKKQVEKSIKKGDKNSTNVENDESHRKIFSFNNIK